MSLVRSGHEAQIKSVRKTKFCLLSKVTNFSAWQTDFSFGTQPQGTGDIKISNCHVYGLADMTVPVHGTYVFEKGEVSRTTAHSY